MQNKQTIKSEIELLRALRTVSEAYEEISVVRMRNVKGRVLGTRDFLERISEVYSDLKAYEKSMAEKDLYKKGTKKPKGEVSVLLSSSSKLYGQLVLDVYRSFVKDVRDSNSDIVIVGKMGKSFYDLEEKKRPYKYFEVDELGMKVEDLRDLMLLLVNYEKVEIYYGKFESLIVQKPTVLSILEGISSLYHAPDKVRSFIFEPSFEEIMKYFRGQVFTSLVKQTVHENQLGKYASRILAMEKALENIESKEKELIRAQKKLKRDSESRRQVSVISSVSSVLVKGHAE